jgi:hypothetical protein
MDEEEPNRNPKGLAKQLIQYADAITAFVVLQSVGFSLALTSKDVRTSVTRALPCIIPPILLIATLVYCGLIYFCHLGETALIGKPSERIPSHTVTRRLRLMRYLIILLANLLVGLALYLTWIGRAIEPLPSPLRLL